MAPSAAPVEPQMDGSVRVELSRSTITIVMTALARLRASEEGNFALGPGSQRLINQIFAAEAELRQQMPDTQAAARDLRGDPVGASAT